MNIREGMKIRNKQHKEWGDWIVLKKYEAGIWEIRGKAGDRILLEDEAHFWEEVS